MAIGNKQIGWSQESNLLWEISRQLEQAIRIAGATPFTTTTTTTTIACNSYTLYDAFITDYATWIDCNGVAQGGIISSGGIYTFCAQIGSIVYSGTITDNGSCAGNTTSSTSSTAAPLTLVSTWKYDDSPCGLPGSTPVDIYLTSGCYYSLTPGCYVYSDLFYTPAAAGYYAYWGPPSPTYMYVDATGLIVNIDVCPQP